MSDNFLKIYNGTQYQPRGADPSNPVDGDIQFSDGTARAKGLWQYLDAAWVIVGSNAGGGGGAVKAVVVKDVKASGGAGGTFTSGAWRTRVLNTLDGDTSFISLLSNQFTLDPGTYIIDASAPGYDCGGHKSLLRNITDSTNDIIGTTTDAGTAGNVFSRSETKGLITIVASKTYEIHHRCATTKSSSGFGQQNSLGVDEVYTQVIITKIG